MTCLLLILGLAACADSVVAPEMSGINLSVTPVSNGLTVTPSTASVEENSTVQLTAYLDDGHKAKVLKGWSSDDTTVATVDSSGRVTGRAEGIAVITAKTTRDRWGTAIVTVTAPSGTVASVDVSPEQATVNVGSTTQLSATVKDANGKSLTNKTVTWKSSNTAVATVSSSGMVSTVAAGSATITAVSEETSGVAEITATSQEPPPSTPGTGIWISKAELDALPMSGTAWSGTGELKHTADASWKPEPVEQKGQVFHLQALAGALVYARLSPDPSAEAYRKKVVQAIRDVMAFPDDLSAAISYPNRFLGTWAITADLINLKEHDPALDTQFRAWLTYKLDVKYSNKTVRTQMAHANNQGSWATFSLAAASAYLGDRATLDQLAQRYRRWLGDTSVAFSLKWTGSTQSWQVNPSNSATWVGINSKGAKRDGYNFDGIQPSDQNRGAPEAYEPTNFPNDFSSVRYNETSLHGVLGAVLILHRAGYTDLVDGSDQAVLRAAKWIKYAADSFPAKGYEYFTGPHEATRPLINYFYPSASLPSTRERTQLSGSAYGYAWTYWTHAGRSVQ
ncbi:MAG: Ig-like domain-containing protein [Gemmatimonadetes bacterium]|nr:Ig-like domain-containing protein [Gemmatimonadota bacterium]